MMLPSSLRPTSSQHVPLLVGREREQANLRRSLDEMLAGRGSLVLVSGEAGIGKTALVEWLAHEAANQGCLVLRGGCYDLTTTPPYGPWREHFQRYARIERSLKVPTLASEQSDVDAFGNVDELAEELHRFFAVASAQKPLILVLEDLHWSDAASLELLRLLGRRISENRTLLVITYRSDELTRRHRLTQLLPLLVRESHARRVDLTRLDRSATAKLLQEQYSLSSADHSRLVEWLVEHADGNPLFIEELLFSLTSAHLRRQSDGSWSLGKLESIKVPTLLLQMIEARLERLSSDLRLLLSVGAVIGHRVPLELWASVSNTSIDLLVTTIEQGKAASILEDSVSGSDWQFRHSLIREALYEDMNALRRQEWHRRVAEILIEQPQPDPDVVASHFQRAGDPRAMDWLIRAGERAAAEQAYTTAVERFETVLPLLAVAGEERRRGWVLFLVSFVVPYQDSNRGITYLNEAERLGNEVGDELLVAYARMGMGYTRLIQSRFREGMTLAREALELMERVGGDETPPVSLHGIFWANRYQWWSGYSMWEVHMGKLASAEAHLANLRFDPSEPRRFGPRGTPDQLWHTAIGQIPLSKGRICSLRGHVDEALQSFGEAAEWFARGKVDSMSASTIMSEIIFVLLPYQTDQPELRHRKLEEHDRFWHTTAAKLGAGDRPEGGMRLVTSYVDGEWSGLEEVETWWRQHMVSGSIYKPMGNAATARRARGQGNVATAWDIIHQQLPDGSTTEPGDSIFVVSLDLQRLAAELELDAERLPEARDWLEAHDRWLEWSGAVLGRADVELLWARYFLVSGDLAQARQRVSQALSLASDPRQPLALIAIHRFLGRLDAAELHFAEAEQHLQASLRLAEACAAPFERALTLLEMAELRMGQRRLDEAATLLDEVHATCTPLKARPTLNRVQALRDDIGQASKRRTSYPAGLSQREVEVLRLVAEGLTDAEIAKKLFLSRRTVNAHLRSVFNKIGIGSRTAAAIWAKEHDLI